MEILNEIQTRRAFRAYDEKAVPADVRDRILKAATLAPSCANNQPWRFIAVDSPDALSKVREGLEPGNYWAKKAPLIIAVVTDTGWDARLDGGREYAYFDTGMASLALMLQATKEGLYAHPIAGFKPAVVKQALGIPEVHVLLTLIICGYPGSTEGLSEKHLAMERSERARKDISAIVAHNAWSDSLLPPPKP